MFFNDHFFIFVHNQAACLWDYKNHKQYILDDLKVIADVLKGQADAGDPTIQALIKNKS